MAPDLPQYALKWRISGPHPSVRLHRLLRLHFAMCGACKRPVLERRSPAGHAPRTQFGRSQAVWGPVRDSSVVQHGSKRFMGAEATGPGPLGMLQHLRDAPFGSVGGNF